jgi:hypothetical protein
MGDRRLLELGRRMRILRHRTARWFLPPVRQAADEPMTELPRLRLLTTAPSSRRTGPTTH